MRKIAIIYKKQVKDTGKNIALLVQFVMFPVMAAIMENAIRLEDIPENFFVNMFAAMYIGMAPLIVTTSVISEEKEKNTLRVLLFANVSAVEYLCGVGGFIFSACMGGSLVFGILGGYTGRELFAFMLIMVSGILVSILFGAAIGIWSKSQISATSVATPAMMVFSFLPMLAMFNETIEKVADLIYSQQIRILLSDLGKGAAVRPKSMAMIAVNFVAAAGLFVAAYREKGLD